MKQDINIKNISPFLQGGFVMLMLVLFIGMGKITSDDPRFPWVVVCAMLLFYSVTNTILSIPTNDPQNYWWKSIVTFLGIAGIGGLIAYGVSGLAIGEAGSTQWLYVVFAVGYLVFISIVNLIKFIISLAQRQDR